MIKFTSLFPSAHVRGYPKGQILLYQGQKDLDTFQIQSGYVKIYDVTAQGREKLLMILGPDDIFPLVWSYTKNLSVHYFYEAYEDTELAVIPRSAIIKAIDDNHEVAKSLLFYSIDRTKVLLSRLETIEATSAKHRVVQVLLYLASAHSKKISIGRFAVTLGVTHQAIADMSGVTRETASIQLKQLQDAKMISHKDDKLVINTKKLLKFLQTE